MKKVWAGLFLLATAAGCSHPAPLAAPPQAVGGMTVSLAAPAPHTGDNTLVLTLRDARTRAPIGNANVTAQADMRSPSLPGPVVSGRAQGNGVYTLPVRLGVATRYDITLHIERTGQPPIKVSFPLEPSE